MATSSSQHDDNIKWIQEQINETNAEIVNISKDIDHANQCIITYRNDEKMLDHWRNVYNDLKANLKLSQQAKEKLVNKRLELMSKTPDIDIAELNKKFEAFGKELDTLKKLNTLVVEQQLDPWTATSERTKL